MNDFRLGQITAPVGIKGEMRVYPYLDDITRFSDISELFVEGEKERRNVEKCRQDKNLLVIKLSGINDRNAAELFRGKYLSIPKEELRLDDDDYFVDDLIGMEVFDEEGSRLGFVKDVLSGTNQDRYLIETAEGKSFALPAVKEFIIDIDPEQGRMTVHLIEGILDL